MSILQSLSLTLLVVVAGSATQLRAIRSESTFEANPQTRASFNFAVDTYNAGTLSVFQCIYQQGYKVAFLQVYGPNNGGSVVSSGCQDVVNAYQAGLGTEIYVTPSPSGKTAAQQFDEAYNGMKNSGINVRKVWLQVTGPINWPNNVLTNINFIQAFISRAQNYGISVGIYTNWYDWQQITGATTQFANSAGLWYWNAYGQGPNAESVASLDDFRPFGGWTSPSVKQFALNEALCGLTLNRNIYPSGSKLVSETSADFELTDRISGNIFVGGFV